eukprot:CAMPEP_0201989586 /NCGR_PEP_ID=MMETSP0904-20121228/92935_1 /ASSEMBLY_ACC=CAM_ASM_000553 /TAXON_ID=420261 /ORGANISM="Thalassiosira antarctica, Strain CCMP982" /LENGTH=115 /DNA_ID=CAMNT_0048543819 /DNA_START=764 /DNA_END=1111 /DNA_ORIENTATION=-
MGRNKLPIKNAVMKDALTKLVKEESARGMGQSKLVKPAAMKDAPAKPRKEVSVVDMVRKSLPKVAVMRDAPTMPRKEESVGGMGQSLLVKNEYSGGKVQKETIAAMQIIMVASST